jgi:hypothetical protein
MDNPVGTRQLSAFTARAMIRVPPLGLLESWTDPGGPPVVPGAAEDGVAPSAPLDR